MKQSSCRTLLRYGELFFWQLDGVNPPAGNVLHWNISQSRGDCKERLSHSVRGQTDLPCKRAICTQERCKHERHLRETDAAWELQSKQEGEEDVTTGSAPSVSVCWQTQGYISDIGASHIIPGWMACPALPPKHVIQARAWIWASISRWNAKKLYFSGGCLH